MDRFIITAPPDEPDYTSPSGTPDWLITEREARLWLLSESERRAGVAVELDSETRRWQRVGERVGRECEVCRKIFHPSRKDALYCSQQCRQKASYRSSIPTVTGRLVSQ